MSRPDRGSDGESKPRLSKAAVPAAAVGAAGAGIGLLVALRPKDWSRALSHLPGRAKPKSASPVRRLLDDVGKRVGSLTPRDERSKAKAGRTRANKLRWRRRERNAGRE